MPRKRKTEKGTKTRREKKGEPPPWSSGALYEENENTVQLCSVVFPNDVYVKWMVRDVSK